MALARTKDRVDVIGQLGRHVEEVGLARGAEVGHGRLDHVPCAVEFVVVAQVGPAPARFLDDVIAIKITIGQLRCRKLGDDLVDAVLERGSGWDASEYEAASSALCRSESMKTGPVNPLVALAAASSRLRMLPDFSSMSKFRGSEAVRLTSWRGLQNESWIWTSVNGTGRKLQERRIGGKGRKSRGREQGECKQLSHEITLIKYGPDASMRSASADFEMFSGAWRQDSGSGSSW